MSSNGRAEAGLPVGAYITAVAVGVLTAVVALLGNWLTQRYRPNLKLGPLLILLVAAVLGIGLLTAHNSNSRGNAAPDPNPAAQTSSPTGSESTTPTTPSTAPRTTTPTASPTISTSTITSQPASTTSRFLGETPALNTNSVDRPVQVMIGTEQYLRSFRMGCSKAGTTATWPVAGYVRLLGKLGVESSEGSSAAVNGLKSTVTFFATERQLGRNYSVSINSTEDLDVQLEGAIQLTIKCNITDPRATNSSYYRVAFGDARVVTT